MSASLPTVGPETAIAHLRNARQPLVTYEELLGATSPGLDGTWEPEEGGKGITDALEGVARRLVAARLAHKRYLRDLPIRHPGTGAVLPEVNVETGLEAIAAADAELRYCERAWLTSCRRTYGPKLSHTRGLLTSLDRRLITAIQAVQDVELKGGR